MNKYNYVEFEQLELSPGEGVRFADDGDDVNAVPESLHQLEVQGSEAVTHGGEEVEEDVHPAQGPHCGVLHRDMTPDT